MANETSTAAKPRLTDAEEMEMIRSAPIMEVAEYLHIGLDLAVQLRVDTAVTDTYEKVAEKQGVIARDIYDRWAAELGIGDGIGQPQIQVTARPIEPQGNLYGFASVTVGGVRIDDFKIVADKDGKLFVGMPSKPDKSSKTGYRNTVLIDKDFRDEFSEAVLRAHYDAVEQEMARAEKMRPAAAADAPPRMAAQVARAAQQAEQHNAALTPRGKEAPDIDGRA